MLRARLNDDLKIALKTKEQLAVSTLRLILAALKDRDIAARGKGNCDGVGEDEILEFAGRRTAPAGARAWNPAFDITPAALIDAIVTEKGVVLSPTRDALAAALRRSR